MAARSDPALARDHGSGPRQPGWPIRQPACGRAGGAILRDQPAPPGLTHEPRHLVAYKTGTSYGFRDAWAAGFTPGYTIFVWAGRPMRRAAAFSAIRPAAAGATGSRSARNRRGSHSGARAPAQCLPPDAPKHVSARRCRHSL